MWLLLPTPATNLHERLILFHELKDIASILKHVTNKKKWGIFLSPER
jgi:hypothetical protein